MASRGSRACNLPGRAVFHPVFGGMDVTVNRITAPGVLLAALALLILGAACGSGPAEPAPVDTALPQATRAAPPATPTATPPTPAPTAPPTGTPAPQADESTPEVGSAVGNLAPDFTLKLADGSELTSMHLQEAGRPVFLYFLTGW